MLENYNPNFHKYEALWAKYGSKTQEVPTGVQLITSQELAAIWSIKLRNYLSGKAKELKIREGEVFDSFKQGVEEFDKKKFVDTTRTAWGLARIHVMATRDIMGEICPILPLDIEAAKEEIAKFGLFFDFNSLDDLFLSDESDISCVYLNE